MRVSLAVLAAFVASNQHDNLGASAFLPSADQHRQYPSGQQPNTNSPRQDTRLKDASAMPYLSDWKLMPEGNIQGIIFGHPFLENGDVVTTSQVCEAENAAENQIIETQSGSHYMLRERDAESSVEQATSTSQGERQISQMMMSSKVASPILGGAAFAATAVGLGMGGESARFDTATPAQAFKEMSAGTLNQFQNSAKSIGDSIDMPYLASKVSDAEKQFQSTRQDIFKQRGPSSNVAGPSVVGEQAAERFEQALAVAAEKVSLARAALNEKLDWDNVIGSVIATEKVENEMLATAERAATKAQAENRMDEAKTASERAKMARAAVMELQAERESAILAEENAAVQEMFAEQDVMSVMREIKQMATTYSVKAARFNPNDAIMRLQELRNNPQLAEFLNSREKQVALGFIAAATTAGAVFAGSQNGEKKEQLAETTDTPLASSSSDKVIAEPVRARAAPIDKSATKEATTTAAASIKVNTATSALSNAGGSYLDCLGSCSHASSVVPSSYSPFGKKFSTTSTVESTSYQSLYEPAVAVASQSTAVPPITPVDEQSVSLKGSLGYLDSLSDPAGSVVMSSYSPFAQNNKMEVRAPTPAPAAKVEVSAHIREAYNEWCGYYGKTIDESRLQIFAANFANAKKFYKESGRALLLNEYADLTASEYKLMPNSA